MVLVATRFRTQLAYTASTGGAKLANKSNVLRTATQILPLRVVTDKTAAAERAVARSAQHLVLGRRLLFFERGVGQAVGHQWLRCAGKVGVGLAVADLSAEIEAAPARERRGAYGCHGRYGRYGLAAAQDWKIVIGGERRGQQAAQQAKSNEQATHDGSFVPQTSFIEGKR